MGKGKARGIKLRTQNEIADRARKWFGTYFCGCGEPDLAMETFREILDWYQPRENALSVSLEAIEAFEVAHGRGLTTLLLYFLGGSELTEHGGSVYGSWMTPLGRDIKQFLEENPDYEP